MRHYVPRQDKTEEKSRSAFSILPLWAWLLLVALCMLLVMALR